MPFELELVELDGAAPPEEELEDVVAGLEDWVDELEDVVAGLDDGVDELEDVLGELDPPQAASPKVASNSRPAANRRINLVVEFKFMSRS